MSERLERIVCSSMRGLFCTASILWKSLAFSPWRSSIRASQARLAEQHDAERDHEGGEEDIA
jgi:hypothetical protein